MPKEPGEPRENELEVITVSELLENLRGNVNAQKEVFGEKLDGEKFDEMLKKGVRGADLIKIQKALGYELPDENMLDRLKEMVEKGELKVEDIYVHPEESGEK